MRTTQNGRRQRLAWLIGLLTLTVIGFCLLTGCTSGGNDVETNPSTVESTPDVTEPTTSDTNPSEDTSADTGDPGDTTDSGENTEETTVELKGWEADTGIFNAGIVTYEKLEETHVEAVFPADWLGKPMTSGGEGVVSVLHTDFSDDDVTIGGLASPRSAGAVVALDGKMYLPYSDSTADHLADGGWTTWCINNPVSLSEYQQTSFSVTWDVRSKDTGAWMSAVIGCYVTNVAGKIPDGPGDGLWLSFQENANKITVYHPDTASWPAGWSDIPVAEGLMSGMFRATVVCSPDRTTYVYICPENGTEDRLVATIRFADGKIYTYNEEGTLMKEADCTTDSLKGEGYSIFVHGGGAATVDEVEVLAASKGSVKMTTTVTATPAEGQTLGLDITDKTDLVSICYSVWFDAILGSGTEKVENWHNITEILAGNQQWGGSPAFHYWAKPAVGYYRSSDTEVIRTHMTQLYTAGVDFIIIDLTNAGDGYVGASAWTNYIQKPMDAICDTIMEMRAEGLGTPYVVFWVGDGEGPLYRELYDKYHAVEKWQDCFVYWEGKPFLLTTHKKPSEFPCSDLYTVRSMWGLKSRYDRGQWSFLNVDNTKHYARAEDGSVEQVSVAVATQETYMSEPTAHGRDGGNFWYNQWLHAFDKRPKVVTLTWWNEWAAQRLPIGDGKYGFTDNYNQEYSRDIEPMEGGHGDQYYQWMIQYISAYKGHLECPKLVEEAE